MSLPTVTTYHFRFVIIELGLYQVDMYIVLTYELSKLVTCRRVLSERTA